MVLSINPQLAEWCEEQLYLNISARQMAQQSAGMVPAVLTCLEVWCGQIQAFVDAVHEQGEAMLRGGPLTELQHWKGCSASCNAVIEQVTRPRGIVRSFSCLFIFNVRCAIDSRRVD